MLCNLLLSNSSIAPAFHLVLETVSDGEVYNLIIRGGNEGGLDGIDVWGYNMHIHDVEVTNKDECITVKAIYSLQLPTYFL
jgi:rhamnogalacturonan hydrolase